MRPALLSFPFNLAPVPFAHFPVVVHTYPPVGNPVSAGMRRTIVVSAYPHVVIAIPTMISRDPNKAGLRRWTGVLHYHSGRGDANHNLRV